MTTFLIVLLSTIYLLVGYFLVMGVDKKICRVEKTPHLGIIGLIRAEGFAWGGIFTSFLIIIWATYTYWMLKNNLKLAIMEEGEPTGAFV